ncbi:MAG TPA: mercuric reductase [Candidatus Binataceae bacterium]|nr:mercuric reductase [Candidatus Binataceae bacterium]
MVASTASEQNRQGYPDNVDPARGAAPVPAECYNLVVVGAGTAGLVAAAGAAALGARVALLERHLMGGDCLNYGCVPSKSLLSAARAVHDAHRAARLGIAAEADAPADFARAMARMRRIRADLSIHDSVARFASLGVDLFHGHARFSGPDSVDVNGQRLRFRRALIATGARAAAPPIPGLAQAGYLTNETIFSLDRLPRRLAVIGGGPLGCELAQAVRRLGSEVTLLEAMPRILPREDADAAARLTTALQREGVEIVTAAAIASVEARGDGKLLRFKLNGAGEELIVDEILAGVGRAPNLADLGLEAAGVAFTSDGITVDDYLRTSNRRIFAAGDVCSSLKFTHAADAMARIVLRNALFFGRARLSALTIPWCIYTDPEIAQVGLTADEATRRGIGFRTLVQELNGVDRAVIDGDADGFVKVHVGARNDLMLGATIVAPHAGEMIGELTLAIQHRLGLKILADAIHPYPTYGEALRKLGDSYNRSRLTPGVRRLLAALMTWRRRL